MDAVQESAAGMEGGASDAELVRRAQGEDRDRAIMQLLERHRDVISHVLRRVVVRNRLGNDVWPDLWQEAAIAMLEAVAKYDPERLGQRGGARFRTFLSRVLERYFRR